MKTKAASAQTALASALGALLVIAPATVAHADQSSDILDALSRATPSTVSSASPTTSSGNHADILTDSPAGTHMAIPREATDGLGMGVGENQLSIGLPFASEAEGARLEQAGIVSYDNGNESTTVPIMGTDGGLQINTVVRSSEAPRRYAYPLDLPDGQSLSLANNGGALVGDSTGVSVLIAPPWAKDAFGLSVPTHYEIEGSTLVQVVEFTDDTAFPVVADPRFWWGWNVFASNRAVDKALKLIGAGTATVGLVTAALGIGGAAGAASVSGLVAALMAFGYAFLDGCNYNNRGVLLGQSWALNAVQSLWPGVKPMPGGFFCIPR